MKTLTHKPFAKKLGVIAVTLSLCFAASSALLLFSVVDEASFDANLLRNISAYFGLDLIGLLIVQGIFAKSLNDAIRNAQESASAPSSSKFGTADRGERDSGMEKSSTRNISHASQVTASSRPGTGERDVVLSNNPARMHMVQEEEEDGRLQAAAAAAPRFDSSVASSSASAPFALKPKQTASSMRPPPVPVVSEHIELQMLSTDRSLDDEEATGSSGGGESD
jgi:hypothetical protein